jgi:hypothetical protein
MQWWLCYHLVQYTKLYQNRRKKLPAAAMKLDSHLQFMPSRINTLMSSRQAQVFNMEEVKYFLADFLFLFHLSTAVVYEGVTHC